MIISAYNNSKDTLWASLDYFGAVKRTGKADGNLLVRVAQAVTACEVAFANEEKAAIRIYKKAAQKMESTSAVEFQNITLARMENESRRLKSQILQLASYVPNGSVSAPKGRTDIETTRLLAKEALEKVLDAVTLVSGNGANVTERANVLLAASWRAYNSAYLANIRSMDNVLKRSAGRNSENYMNLLVSQRQQLQEEFKKLDSRKTMVSIMSTAKGDFISEN